MIKARIFLTTACIW